MQVQHVAPVEGRWSFYVFLPVSTKPHGCTPFRSLSKLDWTFGLLIPPLTPNDPDGGRLAGPLPEQTSTV